MSSVNYVGVFVSAIASMVVGSIWYGPLFGKQFMKAMCMEEMTEDQKKEMQKGMWKSYVLQFIASLVMFYIFAWLLSATDQVDVGGAMVTAFWVWLGFIVPIKLGDAIWGGKMSLFWLGIGNMLVTLLVAGAILGGWQ
jgi:hypothetical protein